MSDTSDQFDIRRMIARLIVSHEKLVTEVKQLRAEVAGKVKTDGWMYVADAAIALKSEGVRNAQHLRKLRLSGVLSESRGEVRNVSEANQPCWQYNIPKCKKAIAKHFKAISLVG